MTLPKGLKGGSGHRAHGVRAIANARRLSEREVEIRRVIRQAAGVDASPHTEQPAPKITLPKLKFLEGPWPPPSWANDPIARRRKEST